MTEGQHGKRQDSETLRFKPVSVHADLPHTEQQIWIQHSVTGRLAAVRVAEREETQQEGDLRILQTMAYLLVNRVAAI